MPAWGSLTTPTGAALITTLAEEFRQPALALNRIGVGVGGKDPSAFPNVLRLWLGETVGADLRADPSDEPTPPVARWQDNIVLLETNLDNATGEQLGFAWSGLFEAGALDVWHTPNTDEKEPAGRPAVRAGSGGVGKPAGRGVPARHPNPGVRVRPVGRYVADRDIVTVETEYGPMRVKRKWLGGEVVSAAPEYEDIAAAARERGVGWSAVSNAIDGPAGSD